jgi:hypothetical protein
MPVAQVCAAVVDQKRHFDRHFDRKFARALAAVLLAAGAAGTGEVPHLTGVSSDGGSRISVEFAGTRTAWAWRPFDTGMCGLGLLVRAGDWVFPGQTGGAVLGRKRAGNPGGGRGLGLRAA